MPKYNPNTLVLRALSLMKPGADIVPSHLVIRDHRHTKYDKDRLKFSRPKDKRKLISEVCRVLDDLVLKGTVYRYKSYDVRFRVKYKYRIRESVDVSKILE